MSETPANSPIIDSQVHAYDRDRPERPWFATLHGPPAVTGDDMVKAMDEVGVDGALLVSPWTMYRYDASYALEVYERHPQRFGLIKPFDPQAADVAEQIEQWAGLPGTVGARIVMMGEAVPALEDLDRVVSAAEAQRLPVNVLCWGKLALFAELAKRHPHAQLIVDHVGLTQTFERPGPSEPFAELAQVVALAAYDNVAIKISGACTLSAEAYPYNDLWQPLQQIFTAFGFERCLWGTDWTRTTAFASYAQAVDAFRFNQQLSEHERAQLMGGSLARIYRWTPGPRA